MDLRDHPLGEADWTLHVDRSSYAEQGKRKAGYETVTLDEIVEAKVLAPGTSAQKAELIAYQSIRGVKRKV